MTQEYTLSTQNIKDAFVQGRLGLYTEIPAEAVARNEENFERWLADHDAQIRAEATETTADTYIIHTPRILPLGVPVDRATLQSVWDAFVTPSQDSGEVQSIEMRALMASLRELYRALPEREGTQ